VSATDRRVVEHTHPCSKCGGETVPRERRRDGHKFRGCATYPACDGTYKPGSSGDSFDDAPGWAQAMENDYLTFHE
jgi:ssDNA-binding Zn-finger/Zn-ribbon topoisomerase 1